MKLDEKGFTQRLKTKYCDRDCTNFNISDFVFAVGSPLEAIMYSRLFWPDFVEVDGMIFINEMMADEEDRLRLSQVVVRHGGDRREAEKSFNLYEVPSDIFGKAAQEAGPEESRFIASLLCEMWSARLAQLYPHRRFCVEVWEPTTTGGDVGVVFYQD